MANHSHTSQCVKMKNVSSTVDICPMDMKQNLVICLVIHTIVLSAVAQTATRHDPFFGSKVESKRKPNEGVAVAKLSTGPFAVRAIETPRVANTASGRESRNINLAGESKTENGRVFALSTGDDVETFGPGQVFRTEDGRLFTLAIAGQKGFLVPAKKQNDVASQEQSLFDNTEKPRSQPTTRTNQVTSTQRTRTSQVIVAATQTPPAVTQVKSAPLEELGPSLTAEEIIAARQMAIEDILAARDRAIQKTSSKRGKGPQRVIVPPSVRTVVKPPSVNRLIANVRAAKELTTTTTTTTLRPSTTRQFFRAVPEPVTSTNAVQEEPNDLLEQQLRFQLQQHQLEIERLQKLQQQLQLEHQKRQQELIQRQRTVQKQKQLALQKQQQREVAQAEISRQNLQRQKVQNLDVHPSLGLRSKSRFQGHRAALPKVRRPQQQQQQQQEAPRTQQQQSPQQQFGVQNILLPISSSNLVRSEDGQLALPLQITLNEDGSTGFLTFPRPISQNASKYRV